MLKNKFFILQFELTKWSFWVHSTIGNAPYIHPSPDSILEMWRTSPKNRIVEQASALTSTSVSIARKTYEGCR